MKRKTFIVCFLLLCLAIGTAFATSANFHSSNDLSTAKKGKTGVYAYSEVGPNYDIYYIIDFDEGYVYYFTHGNDSSECDKVKIVSGTLNDVVIITYHDGGDSWSYGLHFKWANQPSTLIIQDSAGFELSYDTTPLDKALELKNAKTIHEY